MILVCAAISANIVKELKNDHKIEKKLTAKIVEENHESELKTNPLTITNIKSNQPITHSAPINKEKGCEENNEFYFLNFFGKLFLAFTAGVIFSDGVYIKMGIV